MSKKKLGSKHSCLSCGVKFYDLGSGRIVCPRCGWTPDEGGEIPDSEGRDFDDVDDGVLKLRGMYENSESAGDDDVDVDDLDDMDDPDPDVDEP